MNKLVYVLALGVTGIAITVATTVTTDTTASFAGANAAQTVTVDTESVLLTNNVTQGSESNEAQVVIEDAAGTEIGTIDTTTQITGTDSSVESASADATATLSAKA